MRNLVWKLISLFLGIVLWVLAMNITNPIATETFRFRFEVRGEDVVLNHDYILTNREHLMQNLALVDLRVRATRSELTQLRMLEYEGLAFIDINRIQYFTNPQLNTPLPVDVQLSFPRSMDSSQFRQVTIRPSPTVNIVLDRMVSETFRIERIGFDDANTKDGYHVNRVYSEHPNVTIRGAGNDMLLIYSVIAEIDLSEAEENVSQVIPLRVLDRAGQDITSLFTLTPAETTFNVWLNREITLSVSSDIIGSVANGYLLTHVSRSADSFTVVGAVDIINSLDNIVFDDIDVSGATESVVVVFNLQDYLPMHLRYSPQTITVTAHIEREESRAVTIHRDGFITRGGKNAVLPESITVTLRGVERHLQGLSQNNISVTLDLSGLDVGEHRVRVDVELAEFLPLVSVTEQYVTVTILGEGNGNGNGNGNGLAVEEIDDVPIVLEPDEDDDGNEDDIVIEDEVDNEDEDENEAEEEYIP
jgi:YbbR domain-containing protein